MRSRFEWTNGLLLPCLVRGKACGVRIHPGTVATLAIALAAIATSLLAQTDVALRDELIALRGSDQSGRLLLEHAFEQHGPDSPEFQVFVDEQSRVDSTNLARLEAILSEHGWPGQSMVGREAAIGAFLILQHADHSTQIEYLPMVQAAVEAGELDDWTLAMLQDRILVSEGKAQIYGTQLYLDEATNEYELYPIEDKAHVDARRETLGLEPLAEYVRSVGGDD